MDRLKTFKQVLDEGYTFPDIVDEATAQAITDWFFYRRVCDNEKFIPFFDREIKLAFPQYMQLLRIDPTVSSYDWLVSDYTERLLRRGTTVESGQNVMTSVARTGTDTGSVTTGGSNSETVETQANGYNRVGTLAKASPMSTSYNSTQMGANDNDSMSIGELTLAGYGKSFPDPYVDNPSQVTDGLTKTGDISRSSSSGSDSTTMTRNLANGGTEKTSGETTGKTESDETVTEIATGRRGFIAPTLKEAYTYIERSNAFVWLRGRLEKCFMMVFD